VSSNEDAGAKQARTYVGEANLVDKEHRSRSRRIAYFMLFRLAMLALFTVAAAVITARTERGFGTLYTWLVWGGLILGFSHTIVFSWLLPRTRDFDRFAWGQTAADIVISAVVVQMSGGVGSARAAYKSLTGTSSSCMVFLAMVLYCLILASSNS